MPRSIVQALQKIKRIAIWAYGIQVEVTIEVNGFCQFSRLGIEGERRSLHMLLYELVDAITRCCHSVGVGDDVSVCAEVQVAKVILLELL